MASVCLIRPLLSPTDFNGYPLNLLILAQALREAGHVVWIRDYDYLKEIDPSWANGDFSDRAATDILAGRPDFVGITAMCSNYVLAITLAERLKRRSPETHVTFGGPHVSLCALETIGRYRCVDSAVIGEGEVSYPELIAAVVAGRDLFSVPGIAFRRHGLPVMSSPRPLLEDLNLSPRPAYDLVDVRSYVRAARSNYLEVYAGSGCPFQCTFCSTSIVWKRKYRTMSAERIVDEMEALHRCYEANAFNLIHDNLSTDKEFIREIASLINDRGLEIRWGFSSRIDTLDAETVAMATGAGCDYVFFGVETGSTKIQATMKKKLKLHMIHDTLESCIQAGIRPTTSFIIGFPDEQLSDVVDTIRLAFKCKVAGARRSFINLLSPYTGTPVMRDHADRLVFDERSLNTTMISFLTEEHFELIKADPFTFSNYYSLDHTESSLTSQDYLELVDFFAIGLFRYPFTFWYLLDVVTVDPIALFRGFAERLRRMSTAERNRLEMTLSMSDLLPYVTAEHEDGLASVFCLDMSLHLISDSGTPSVLYSGRVQLASAGLNRALIDTKVRHYLHQATSDAVHTSEISEDLSRLYELRGLPAVRAESFLPAGAVHV